MIADRNLDKYRFEDKWFIPNPRSYFDAYSHQFNRLTWENKLENLAVLIYNGMDLPEIISNYIDSHSDNTLDSLKDRLIAYIQYIRWGECIHCTNMFFDDFSSIEIAETLQNELKLRYQSGIKELIYSRWNEDIEVVLVKRAKKSRKKLKAILMNTDFSREFLNK